MFQSLWVVYRVWIGVRASLSSHIIFLSDICFKHKPLMCVHMYVFNKKNTNFYEKKLEIFLLLPTLSWTMIMVCLIPSLLQDFLTFLNTGPLSWFLLLFSPTLTLIILQGVGEHWHERLGNISANPWKTSLPLWAHQCKGSNEAPELLACPVLWLICFIFRLDLRRW